MTGLLDQITVHVPAPCDSNSLSLPLALTVNNIGSDPYLGQLATGKVVSGVVEMGMLLKTLSRTGGGAQSGPHKVGGVFVTNGIAREPLEGGSGGAGDIITLAGAR
ncbi:unnamed protein product [Discosporangium mesarthrocarpum]